MLQIPQFLEKFFFSTKIQGFCESQEIVKLEKKNRKFADDYFFVFLLKGVFHKVGGRKICPWRYSALYFFQSKHKEVEKVEKSD